MTLMLDPEPTVSADTVEDETQSLHAWSQTDDGDAITEYIPQRSWKLPITLAVTAVVGMIGAAAYLELPTHPAPPVVHTAPAPSAAKPQVAPKPLTKDERFVALFRSRGGLVEPGREQMVITEAHQACTRLASEDENHLIADMIAGTPGMTHYTAGLFADSAIDVYCPGAK